MKRNVVLFEKQYFLTTPIKMYFFRHKEWQAERVKKLQLSQKGMLEETATMELLFKINITATELCRRQM